MLLYAHVHLRHPHSFPTRRSSDLNFQVCPSGLRRANHVSPKRSPLFSRAPFANSAAETCLRDRKSTRLNSSHRCISYAVFCLKTKKQEGKSSGIHTRMRLTEAGAT